MKKSTPKITLKKSLKYTVALAFAVSVCGIYLNHRFNSRLYKSPLSAKAEDKDNDEGRDAQGMAAYFFNARKNNITGKMDYAAMQRTENSLQALQNSHRATAGALGLNWTSMGPTNVGGRTRAIIFDNQDHTGNTMFAGAVSGGIWKSTNAGATWSPVDDNLQSLEACCLAQASNGYIYCGTGEDFLYYSLGEGFSTGMIGGGIFVSKDDGATFTRLPSTAPPATNDTIQNNNGAPANGAQWAYVDRIAISPCNDSIIYAATNEGLFISHDAGSTWQHALNSATHSKISGISHDVKISTDGKVVVASINGTGYIQRLGACGENDSLFTAINSGLVNHKLGGGNISSRIEFAISPTNPAVIYASVANGGSFVGIYMAMDTGKTWYEIGTPSPTFNPFGNSGENQANYDNCIAVFPTNQGEILLGGLTFWFWQQGAPGDSVGSWENISYYGEVPGGPGVHADDQTITFDPYNPNIVYIGCDGGIFQTLNINTLNTNPAPNNLPDWYGMNRNYVTTQFFTVAFAADSFAGSSQFPVLGGTQDNGTPYVPGNVNGYPQDQLLDASGGDGGGCAFSYINPNVGFTTVHYGNNYLRITNAPSFANFLTTTGGIGKGANIDSISNLAGNLAGAVTCFVPPVALYENMYDKNTTDSIRWIADKNYRAGDTIYPVSPNGLVSMTYILPKAVVTGDSVMVQNVVVSKAAIAFNSSYGVWMNMQAVDLSDPIIWMPIGGPLSKPDAFGSGTDKTGVHSLAWSMDGDAIFAGTEGGSLFRFSNLNNVRDTSYLQGALWSEGGSGNSVTNPNCRVLSYNVGGGTFTGRDILSITINPANQNDAIITLGNYSNSVYIYYSSNAMSVSPLPTWTSKQGNLPYMPVYSASYALQDGGAPNQVVIGTEHGVWSTANITAASPTWTRDNNGAPNTLVLAIHQQNTPPWLCKNSGRLYMGTHGRGIWSSSSLGPLSVPPITTPELSNDLKVYPSPMSVSGTVDLSLAKEADNITLTIYDITGRAVQSQYLGKQTAGEHLIPIQTSGYNEGEYIVSVTGDNYRQSGRFMVVH